MGFCFSCCRRRTKHDRQYYTDTERQPLLRSDTDALQPKRPEEQTPYEKVTDVLAALHVGKLPSQQQVDGALRKLLRSGLLDAENGEDGGALNESGRKVLEDAREVVGVMLQVGLEKNDDNKLQDLLYQLRELSSRSVPVDLKSGPEIRINDETVDQVQTAGALPTTIPNTANPDEEISSASAIPSQDEISSDTVALLSSLRTLSTLVLTSSAFRLILGDLLLTAREFVADTAEQVRKVAETIERISETVELNVRPDSEIVGGVQSVVVESQATAPPSIEQVGQESKSPKEVVLDRIEDIFRQAQASPQYNSALRTLLYIFRKYAERVSLASAAISQVAQPSSGESLVELAAPVVIPDPRFSRVLEDLRILLERFASGKSLDPLLQTLYKTVHDLSVVPTEGDGNDAQIYFTKVGLWLDNALADPSFASSRAGRDAASRLYDEGLMRLSQDRQLSDNLQHLLMEGNTFVDALKSDRSTNKLLNTLDRLHSNVLVLLGRAAQTGQHAAAHWHTTLLRAALGWLLPRFLRAIRVLPMPRFEYTSSMPNGTHIAAAIDTLLLSAEEALVPDVLSVQEFVEVRVEVDENVGAAELTSPNVRLLSARKNANQRDLALESARTVPMLSNGSHASAGSDTRKGNRTSVTTISRVRVHVEGLRVAAHDVGYYASYARNSWLGYTDEGLLSVDIGRGQRRGEGLAVEMELEMNSDSKDSGHTTKVDETLFRVLDVRTSLPGLALHIAHSRHWILNSLLLAPLAGPIGRALGTRVLNAQIRSTLESFEKMLREMKGQADAKAQSRTKEEGGEAKSETNASDWWDALLEKFGAGSEEREGSDESSDHEDEDEQGTYAETHTEATLTGVVRTTIEQPEQTEPGSEAPPSTESAIAVGLGAQLLPGKAEPATLGVERESPQQATQEVAGAAREATEDVQGKVRDVQEAVQGAAQQGIEEAVRVRQMAEAAEERMERQESRERRKGGWISQAFDL